MKTPTQSASTARKNLSKIPIAWKEKYNGKECQTFETSQTNSYIHVVLHALLHTPLLLNWLEHICSNNLHKCFLLQCCLRTFWELANTYWGLNTLRPTTSDIKSRLDALREAQKYEQTFQPVLGSWAYGDVAKYMGEFLGTLERHLEKSSPPDRPDVLGEFRALFRTDIYETKTCNRCKDTVPQPSASMILAIGTGAASNTGIFEAGKGIDYHHKLQDQRTYLTRCQKEGCRQKTMQVTRFGLPSVLLVKNRSRARIQCYEVIPFPDSLLAFSNTPPLAYELRAVIIQKNASLGMMNDHTDNNQQGSFEVIVRSPNGVWRGIDGENVEIDVRSPDYTFRLQPQKSVYALLYQRISLIPAKARLKIELHTGAVLEAPMDINLHHQTSFGQYRLGVCFKQDGTTYYDAKKLQMQPKMKGRDETEESIFEEFINWPPSDGEVSSATATINNY